jgi:glycolate oxidase iron-sulfur subunit
VARAVAFGKKSGLSRAARALGLLRFLGRDFPRAEGIVEQLPEYALRDEIPPGTLSGRGTMGRILYFVGCGMDLVCTDAARASIDLLLGMADTVEVLNNCCCGLPAVTYGDFPAARRLAIQNLQLLSQKRFDLIVTDCSSCASFLKKYPTLFAKDSPWHREAEDAAGRVRDLVQVLGSNGDPAPASPEARRALSVTWHDPCHARRGQNLALEPRRVLQSIPGVEYRELPEADWCCGGAGSYSLFHYDLSQKVLKRKIDNVARSGAEVVTTSCPACIIHLSYGVRKMGLQAQVRHLSEVVSAKRRE